MQSEGTAQVLLVDDDPQIVDIYRTMLEDSYEVYSATSGKEALEILGDGIEVVLLDRRMPGLTGDEVAAAIRERGYSCRVAMVTAHTPEVDIIDMGIDDYLVKPVTKSKLRNVIDSLLRWGEYDAVLREYFECARKVAVLKEELPRDQLESDTNYQQRQDRLDTLRFEADTFVENAGTEILEAVLGELTDGDSRSESADPATSNAR